MEQQFPIALQVALYAASGSVVLGTAVAIIALRRMGTQLDRVVTALERFEAEVTPLARETRAVVDRLHDLSDGAQRMAGVAGGLVLAPLLSLQRTLAIVQAGTAAFLRAFHGGRKVVGRGAPAASAGGRSVHAR